jgi:hypothetical protein
MIFLIPLSGVQGLRHGKADAELQAARQAQDPYLQDYHNARPLPAGRGSQSARRPRCANAVR